jgi:hypothetical protein
MKKVLLLMMCVFGFQSASYGFLGTALNTESEQAFLKSLETHSGMTDEQAQALLIKASRLQSQLHGWSAAGAVITAPFLVYFLCMNVLFLKWTVGDLVKKRSMKSEIPHIYTSGVVSLHVLALGIAGWTFSKSLAASIRAKKRASQYKKIAQHAAHLKHYQRFTERCGYMADYYGKSAWNTVAKGRKEVMKKGLNAQLIGTSIGAFGLLASVMLLYNTWIDSWGTGEDGRHLGLSNGGKLTLKMCGFVIPLSAAFTLFSTYALKGIVRKQAMKKLMAQIEHKSPGACAIARDPEAAALAQIAEWEQEEAAADAQPVA